MYNTQFSPPVFKPKRLVGVYYTRELNIILGYMHHHIQDTMTKSYLYLWFKLTNV